MAFSRSPPVSVRAFLQSSTPAPVFSRSSLIRFAEISAIFHSPDEVEAIPESPQYNYSFFSPVPSGAGSSFSTSAVAPEAPSPLLGPHNSPAGSRRPYLTPSASFLRAAPLLAGNSVPLLPPGPSLFPPHHSTPTRRRQSFSHDEADGPDRIVALLGIKCLDAVGIAVRYRPSPPPEYRERPTRGRRSFSFFGSTTTTTPRETDHVFDSSEDFSNFWISRSISRFSFCWENGEGAVFFLSSGGFLSDRWKALIVRKLARVPPSHRLADIEHSRPFGLFSG